MAPPESAVASTADSRSRTAKTSNAAIFALFASWAKIADDPAPKAPNMMQNRAFHMSVGEHQPSSTQTGPNAKTTK